MVVVAVSLIRVVGEVVAQAAELAVVLVVVTAANRAVKLAVAVSLQT